MAEGFDMFHMPNLTCAGNSFISMYMMYACRYLLFMYLLMWKPSELCWHEGNLGDSAISDSAIICANFC